MVNGKKGRIAKHPEQQPIALGFSFELEEQEAKEKAGFEQGVKIIDPVAWKIIAANINHPADEQEDNKGFEDGGEF